MSGWALLSLYGIFVGALLLAVIASLFAPALLDTEALGEEREARCVDPACSAAEFNLLTPELSPLNQFVLVSVRLRKPVEDVHGDSNPFQRFAVEYLQEFDVAIWGQASGEWMLLANRSHSRDVACLANTDFCSSVTVFTETHLNYSQFRLGVRLLDPLEPYGGSQSVPGDVVVFSASSLSVHAESTRAEVAFRYFCFTVGFLFAAIYIVLLNRCLPKTASWSLEQRWSVALLLGVTLFSNPLVLPAVENPGVVWSALNVFFTVTFFCTLLFFWLVYTHVIVLAASRRLSSSATLKLSTMFFLPKLVFMTFLYAAVLFGSMFVLYRLELDPAFSLWDDTPYPIFILGIGTAVAIIYMLWLLVYVAFAIRALFSGSLSPPFRLYVALTVTAMVAIIAAFFAGGVSPKPVETTTTYGLFAAANMYVWLFAFMNLPGLDHRGGGRFSEATAAEHSHVAEASASSADDTTGILGDAIGEAEAEELELELTRSGPKSRPRPSGDEDTSAIRSARAYAIDDDDDDDDDDVDDGDDHGVTGGEGGERIEGDRPGPASPVV